MNTGELNKIKNPGVIIFNLCRAHKCNLAVLEWINASKSWTMQGGWRGISMDEY